MVKWTKKEIAKLKVLCKQGKKIREIADIMDRTKTSVAAKINEQQQRGNIPYKNKRKAKKVGLDKEAPYEYKTKDLFPKLPYQSRMYKPKGKPLHKETTQTKISKTLQEIGNFLLEKNKQYGDSALQPIRIFSKADKQEQLKVRIDDKLNRLVQGNDKIEADEDVIKDLIGYFVLLLIQMRD